MVFLFWVFDSVARGCTLNAALLVSFSTLLLVMKVEDSHWFLLGAAWKISERLLSSNATARAEPVTTLQINTASGSLRSTSPSKANPRQIHWRQDSSEAISADVKSVWKIYRSLSQCKEPAYRVVLTQWNLPWWLDVWINHLGAFLTYYLKSWTQN